MNLDQLLGSARDTITVKRVFGEPIERDGALIIPVAMVAGGGGGGESPHGEERGADAGAGFGVWARPIGVYVVRDGDARFRPAIDVVPLVLVAGLVLRWLLRSRRRRR